jgi:tetratricopeptide (TPR) repeat protein
MTAPLRAILALLTRLRSWRAARAGDPSIRADERVEELLERAGAARAAGRPDEARRLFEHAARVHHVTGETRAAIHHELGRLEAERGRTAAALAHFKSALRAHRGFVPAALALGDAQEHAGDPREAVRTWERAAEVEPALALLGRLERAFRDQGLPRRMIALYRAAAERAPDNLALAVGLGRVYFELEMLDEAADQFEKIEVRAPDAPIVHAFLGATFERRGESREAFAEYRRALHLARGFDWPHACVACGASTAAWDDRCPGCLRLNTIRPVSVEARPGSAGGARAPGGHGGAAQAIDRP